MVKNKTAKYRFWSCSNPTGAFIDGQCVEAVDSFLYLGSEITSSGYSSCDIIRRIVLASSGQAGRVWSNRQLSLSSKLLIYNYCMALLLYGSEAWTILKADRQKLQSFHLRCQRRILGIRLFDFVTNADVSAPTGLTDVHSIISRRRHALFGHIRRLSPDTPAHKVLHMAVQMQHWSFRPNISWRRPQKSGQTPFDMATTTHRWHRHLRKPAVGLGSWSVGEGSSTTHSWFHRLINW